MYSLILLCPFLLYNILGFFAAGLANKDLYIGWIIKKPPKFFAFEKTHIASLGIIALTVG